MKAYTLFLLNVLCWPLLFGQTSFNALTDKGYQELSDGNAEAARQTLERALRVLPTELKLGAKADFYSNLGVAYYQTGDYRKGIDAYKLSLGVYQQIDNDSLVAGALLNLGLAYKEIGAFKQATKELTNAARLSERYGNRQELSAAWNAIGNIQKDAGNFSKALVYHQRALRIRKDIRYNKGIADSYHNIGTLYLEWKRYKEAEQYLLEALQRKKVLNNQSNLVNTLSSLGRLYLALREPKKALTYLNSAYELRLEAGNSTKAASSLYYLGTYYASVGNPTKALELFRQTQDIARTYHDTPLLADALEGEIHILERKAGNSPLIEKYQDLINSREKEAEDANRKEAARLEVEYDVERKEQEIKLRRKQSKLDHMRIENEELRNQQLVSWLIGLTLAMLVASLLLYQIRKRKRYIELQNQELHEQRDEIKHLHQELSHRTKNYFILLSGILKSDKAHVKHEETYKVLQQNIRRLDAMSLVQHYLLDDSARRNKEVRLDAYLGKLVDLIVYNLFPNGSDLKLTREINAIHLDYDSAMRLAISLNELLCNAVEHGLIHSQTPELFVSVKQSGKKIEMCVRDNGPGIEEQQIRSKAIKGQELIAKLLQKVGGTVTYHNDNGCVAIVGIRI